MGGGRKNITLPQISCGGGIIICGVFLPHTGMRFATDHCLGLVPAQSQHSGCALFCSDVYGSAWRRHLTDRNFRTRDSDGTES